VVSSPNGILEALSIVLDSDSMPSQKPLTPAEMGARGGRSKSKLKIAKSRANLKLAWAARRKMKRKPAA